MTSTPTSADRRHRFWFLQQVELWLDAMPRRRRRAVLQELRMNLDAAAADRGMEAALTDLGRPRALAAQYLEAEPAERPHWIHGTLAALVVFAFWLYSTFFYTIGMLDALSDVGATAPAGGSFLGTSVLASAGPEGLSAEFGGVPWVPLVVLVLAFLVVSRAWKALPQARTTLA